MHRKIEFLMNEVGVTYNNTPQERSWQTFLRKLDTLCDKIDKHYALLEESLEIYTKKFHMLSQRTSAEYERIFHVFPDTIFSVDKHLEHVKIHAVGKQNYFDIERGEYRMETLRNTIFPPTMYEESIRYIESAIRKRKFRRYFFSAIPQNGMRMFYEMRIEPFEKESGESDGALCIVTDITKQRFSIEYLKVIRKIFDEALEGIMIVSLTGNGRIETNRTFWKIVGKVSFSSAQRFDLEKLAEYFERKDKKAMFESIERTGSFHSELPMRREDGKSLWVWLSVNTIYNDYKEPLYRVVMLTDISQLKASREKLHFAATHDPLTQLPNRAMIFERLQEAVAQAKRSKETGAVLFIDLDNFKTINDTAGHKMGDKVLVESAQRIKRLLGEHDTAGRFGGDEFIVIMRRISEKEASERLAKNILKAFEEKVRFDGHEYEIGASIGIAYFPDDAENAETLIQHADTAMYSAKAHGKNRYCLYGKAASDIRLQRKNTVNAFLRKALNEGGFELLFQPQFDLFSQEVTAVEALLRLDKKIGYSHPSEFIAVAEESGQISEIGRWVFESCCKQYRSWRDGALKQVKISVNLSAKQLYDGEWCDFVRDTIETYAVAVDMIEFEITEETLMRVLKENPKVMKCLQSIGFAFVIDDFGTGYSSLPHLKNLAITKLKIDKRFIDEINGNDEKRSIVKATIAMADALDIKTVAEGVETYEQTELLRQLHCDGVQGYYFAKPESAEKIAALLS